MGEKKYYDVKIPENIIADVIMAIADYTEGFRESASKMRHKTKLYEGFQDRIQTLYEFERTVQNVMWGEGHAK